MDVEAMMEEQAVDNEREQQQQRRPPRQENVTTATHTPSGIEIKYTKRGKPVFKLDESSGGDARYYCWTCQDYVPATKFYESSIKNTERKCKQHFTRWRTLRYRETANEFTKMYRYLRGKEKEYFHTTSLTHITTDTMKLLVEEVWNYETYEFENYRNNPSEIKLVRWDPSKPCVPWNMCCFTTTDALKHLRSVVTNKMALEDVYEPDDIEAIELNNNIARELFFVDDMELFDEMDFTEKDSEDPFESRTTAAQHHNVTKVIKAIKRDMFYKRKHVFRDGEADMLEHLKQFAASYTSDIKIRGPEPTDLDPAFFDEGTGTFDASFVQKEDDHEEEEQQPKVGKKRTRTPANAQLASSKRRRQ